MSDLYETLEVPRDASKKDITKAYRRKARKAHPDCGGKAEEFHAIVRAHKILTNDALRAKYDATGKIEEEAIEPDNALADVLNLLSQCLTHVIATLLEHRRKPEQEDLVHLMREKITEQLAEARANLKKLSDAEQTLNKLKGRFETTRGEENLMERLVATQFAEIERARKQNEAIEGRAQKGLEFLKGFKFKADRKSYGGNFTGVSSMYWTGS